MEKFQAWVQQLDFTQLWEMLIVVAASLLCITFHETCHGLVAYWMGDPTARSRGGAGSAHRYHGPCQFLGKAGASRYAQFPQAEGRNGAHGAGGAGVECPACLCGRPVRVSQRGGLHVQRQ